MSDNNINDNNINNTDIGQDNGNDSSDREGVCSICLRPESSCGKLLKMPPGIFICNDCLQKTFDMMNANPSPMPDFSNLGQNMMFNLGPLPEVPENQRVKKHEKKEKQPLPELDQWITVLRVSCSRMLPKHPRYSAGTRRSAATSIQSLRLSDLKR